MKIVRSRGNIGGKDEERKLLTSELIEKLRKEAVQRFDGTASQPNDIHVLLETGKVIAVPSQVFRGRIAFKFEKKKNKLILVCAWCGKNMGQVESKIEGISHGMCQECFDRVLKTEVSGDKS